MEEITDLKRVVLRSLARGDILEITKAFCDIGWNKPSSIYERYLKEQNNGDCEVIVAWSDGKFIGYVTLKWDSDYPPFKKERIPEIKDLNVLPFFRRKGVGSLLLDRVEEVAFARTNVVGLGFGLTADYQDGFRLYVKRGYLPDGNGLYHPHLPSGFAQHGDYVCVDDDCTLWLTKEGMSIKLTRNASINRM